MAARAKGARAARTEETPDAFSELIDATRQPQPARRDFGGGALERRSISEQVANRILSMI